MITLTLGELKRIARVRPDPKCYSHPDEPSANPKRTCAVTGRTVKWKDAEPGWYQAYTVRYYPKPFFLSPGGFAAPDDTPIRVEFEEWNINADTLEEKDLAWAIDRITRGVNARKEKNHE